MQSKDWFSVIISTFNEAKNIQELMESIHSQDYRPIEIIVVDGGSTDGTLDIVKSLRRSLATESFEIRLIEQDASSKSRSVSQALNLGINSSVGKYVIPLDADTLFLRKDFLKTLQNTLKRYPVVRYKTRVIIDSWIEYHISLDKGENLCLAQAFRRKILDKVKYDEKLGFGEDLDFLNRLREHGFLTDETPILDLEAGIHEPHTIGEYTIQRYWHGRTVWPFLKKYPNQVWSITMPFSPSILLLVAAIVSLVNLTFGLIILSPFVITIFYFYVSSPARKLDRLIYITFRLTYLSLVRTFGGLVGFYQYYLRRRLILGRDK